MKLEDLKKANELSKKIKDLKTLVENTRNQKCEWIVFTFGHGSNKSTVCTDKDTIEAVRDLVLTANIDKLTYFEEKLFDL